VAIVPVGRLGAVPGADAVVSAEQVGARWAPCRSAWRQPVDHQWCVLWSCRVAMPSAAASEAIMRTRRRYDLSAREAIVRAVNVNRCDRGLLWIADL